MNEIKLNADVKMLQVGNDYQIAGLVFSGADKSFILTLPHKHEDIHENLCHLKLDQQGVLDLLKQLDLLEVEIFAKDASGITKQIVRKSQRQIDNIMQWQVFKRDNYACRYCGRDGIPMSVDHVIVWEEGGPTIADNLVTSCKSCNRDRGSMPYDQWLGSPIYAKKSKNLTEKQKNANIMVAMDLPRLQGMKFQNVRSR